MYYMVEYNIFLNFSNKMYIHIAYFMMKSIYIYKYFLTFKIPFHIKLKLPSLLKLPLL